MIDITTSLTAQNEQDNHQLFLLFKILYLQGQTGLRFYIDEKLLTHILLPKTFFGDDDSKVDLQTQLLILFKCANIQGHMVGHEALQNRILQTQPFHVILTAKINQAILGLEDEAKLSCLNRLSCLQSLNIRRMNYHKLLWDAVNPKQFVKLAKHDPFASFNQQAQQKGPTRFDIQHATIYDSERSFSQAELQKELDIQSEKFCFETLVKIEEYQKDKTISLGLAIDLPSCSTIIKEDENTNSVCLNFQISAERLALIRKDCFLHMPRINGMETHIDTFSVEDRLISELLQHDAKQITSIISQEPNLKCNIQREFRYRGITGFSITLMKLKISPESLPTFINHMLQIFLSAGLLGDYTFSIIETIDRVTAEKKHQQKIDSLISCTDRFFAPNLNPSKWVQYPSNQLKDGYIGHDVRYLSLKQDDKEVPTQLVKSLCDLGFHAVKRSTTNAQTPLVVVDLTQSIFNDQKGFTKSLE